MCVDDKYDTLSAKNFTEEIYGHHRCIQLMSKMILFRKGDELQSLAVSSTPASNFTRISIVLIPLVERTIRF